MIAPAPATLATVGHGTLSSEQFTALLASAGIDEVVDVRSAPGSRRNPAFARVKLERALPARGLAYHWEPRLGGFRRPRPDSPNTALRQPGFRGYADHMREGAFAHALDEVLRRAVAASPAPDGAALVVLCAESVWWRCHRRLLADAAVLLGGATVEHLMHDGRVMPHRLTEGVRVGDDGLVVYDAGVTTLL